MLHSPSHYWAVLKIDILDPVIAIAIPPLDLKATFAKYHNVLFWLIHCLHEGNNYRMSEVEHFYSQAKKNKNIFTLKYQM